MCRTILQWLYSLQKKTSLLHPAYFATPAHKVTKKRPEALIIFTNNTLLFQNGQLFLLKTSKAILKHYVPIFNIKLKHAIL